MVNYKNQVNEVFRYKRWIFNHDVRSVILHRYWGPGTGFELWFHLLSNSASYFDSLAFIFYKVESSYKPYLLHRLLLMRLNQIPFMIVKLEPRAQPIVSVQLNVNL